MTILALEFFQKLISVTNYHWWKNLKILLIKGHLINLIIGGAATAIMIKKYQKTSNRRKEEVGWQFDYARHPSYQNL